MLKDRTFHIVWAAPDHGVGIESTAAADAVVSYHKTALKLSARN